jgi:hypothetical protein
VNRNKPWGSESAEELSGEKREMKEFIPILKLDFAEIGDSTHGIIY